MQTRGCRCFEGEEKKPKSWLWRDTHSLISLPWARQVGDGERKMILFGCSSGSRKVMPREGWCCGQGSSWHRGHGRLLAASHEGKSQSSPGTSTCIPGSDGATAGFPERQKAGGKWDLSVLSVPRAPGGQNTRCHHQKHHGNRLCGQGKGREMGVRTWELPFPQASSVSPGSRPPPAAGDHNARKEGTHRDCGSNPGLESKINTCGKGQGGKQLCNDGSGGPRASPAALR